jgi:hypothetical protein
MVKIHINYSGLNNTALQADVKKKAFFQKKGSFNVDISETAERVKVIVSNLKKPKTQFILTKEGKQVSKAEVKMAHMKSFNYEEILTLVNWKKLGLNNVAKMIKKAKI